MSYEQLSQLRVQTEEARQKLIDAEAELADRQAEIHAFELMVEAKVGYLIDQLAQLEAEVADFHRRMHQYHQTRPFDRSYVSVEEQYRRAWEKPPQETKPTPPPAPPSPLTEKQVKKLYRKLARHFHPDLAVDEADRAYRAEKMRVVNEAYTARSLTELEILAQEMTNHHPILPTRPEQTEAEMVVALKKELARCQRRLRAIQQKLVTLHNHPSVQFSLEVNLNKREGRDVLAEMVTEVQRKIARREAELGMLRSQFKEAGIQRIDIRRYRDK